MADSYDELDSFFDNSEIRFKTQSPIRVKSSDVPNRLYLVLFTSVSTANQLVGGYVKFDVEMIQEGRLFLDVVSQLEYYWFKEEDSSPPRIRNPRGDKEKKDEPFNQILENSDQMLSPVHLPRKQLPALHLIEEVKKNRRIILYDESIEIFEFESCKVKEKILILPFKLDLNSRLLASRACLLKLSGNKRMKAKLYHTLTCRFQSKGYSSLRSFAVPLTIIDHRPPDQGAHVSKMIDGKFMCSMSLSHTVIHLKAQQIHVLLNYDRLLPYQNASFVVEAVITGEFISETTVEVFKETVPLKGLEKKNGVCIPKYPSKKEGLKPLESSCYDSQTKRPISLEHVLDLSSLLPSMESISSDCIQISFNLCLHLTRTEPEPKSISALNHCICLTRIPSRQYYVSTDKRSVLYDNLHFVDYGSDNCVMLPFTNIVLDDIDDPAQTPNN